MLIKKQGHTGNRAFDETLFICCIPDGHSNLIPGSAGERCWGRPGTGGPVIPFQTRWVLAGISTPEGTHHPDSTLH